MDLLPPLAALAAGIFFSLGVFMQAFGGDHVADRMGAFVTLATTAVLCWLVAPFVIDWSWFGTRAALVFAGIGVVFPAASQRLAVLSVRQVGPAVSGSLGSFAPLFAALTAILFLGERLEAHTAAGMALMVGGVIISTTGGRGSARTWPVWMVALPLAASLIRGVVQPVTKPWMDSSAMAFFAVLVMTTVSAAVAGAIFASARQGQVRGDLRAGLKWFMLNGVCVGMGVLLLQIAIAHGRVVVVAPLASTVPLGTLVLGRLVFRRERIGPRQWLMAAMTVAGTVLIVAG